MHRVVPAMHNNTRWESKENGLRLFSAVPSDQTRSNGHKLNYVCINKRKLFHSVSSHTLEQASQRGCKVSILEATPNLTGQDPEQSALAASAFRRAAGLDYFLSCLPPSAILGLWNLPFWLIFYIS